MVFRRKLFKSGGEYFFCYLKNIFLRGKTHFKVKLIKLTGRTVCSCILIPKAGRNLEILIHTGYHEKLLILLRCLGQCIEFAIIMSGRYNIVSCPFWRRRTEDRRLYFHKTHFCHLFTKKPDNTRTKNHIVHDLTVTKVKETIFQTKVFSDFLGCTNLKRKLSVHLTQYFYTVCFQINGSRGNLWIKGLLVTLFDFSLNADTIFFPDSLKECFVSHNNLKHTVHIPQIYKGYTAVVTNVFYPTGNFKLCSDIIFGNLIQSTLTIQC